MNVLRELFMDFKNSLSATFQTGMPSILWFHILGKTKNSSASDWTAKQPQHVSKQMKGIWTLQGSSGLNIWVYDSGTGYSQKIDASDQETV